MGIGPFKDEQLFIEYLRKTETVSIVKLKFHGSSVLVASSWQMSRVSGVSTVYEDVTRMPRKKLLLKFKLNPIYYIVLTDEAICLRRGQIDKQTGRHTHTHRQIIKSPMH